MYNYDETIFNEEIYRKIKRETGLNKREILWYEAFISESYQDDGMIISEKVKERIKEFISLIDENKENKEYYGVNIDELFPYIMHIFEKKNLIDYHVAGDGKKYPRLIGYNYLNDPEFYVAYRKIGETKWTNRLPRKIALTEVSEYLIKGYEFREKDITNLLFN